jgi:hypothetical protein
MKYVTVQFGYSHYLVPEEYRYQLSDILAVMIEVEQRGWGSSASYTPVNNPGVRGYNHIADGSFLTREEYDQQRAESKAALELDELKQELSELRKFKNDTLAREEGMKELD